jgi:hypothetical protein
MHAAYYQITVEEVILHLESDRNELAKREGERTSGRIWVAK